MPGLTFLRLLRRWNTPRAIYVGDHTLLARTVFGDDIYLDSRDVSLTPRIALRGEWENGIAGVFGRMLRPGMHVVDLGANCGFYALLAARRVGAQGRVTAIEANPRMVELMRRSFQANRYHERARALHGAVMDREGVVELGVPDQFLGSASVHVKAGRRTDEVSVLTAPGNTLDAWLGPDPRVDVIKMDCEGAEPLIWAGSAGVRAANRRLCIFMEFAPPMIGELIEPARFLEQIRADGFDVQAVRGGRIRRDPDAVLLRRPLSELILRRGG